MLIIDDKGRDIVKLTCAQHVCDRSENGQRYGIAEVECKVVKTGWSERAADYD